MKHAPLLIILATVFIALVGFGVVIPLIPVYAERFGAGGTEVGLLVMSYSLMQFVMAPVAGRISDRIGRRPVIIASLLITAVSYVIFGLAQNLTWLFISRLLGGVGGADITVAQAYIADVTPPEKRARGMGLFGAAFGVGFTLGPALTALTVPLAEWLPAFIAAGLAAGTAIFALFLLPEPERHAQRSPRRIAPKLTLSRPVMIVVVTYFVTVFIQSILWAMQVLFTVERFGWSEFENGLFLSSVGLWSALLQAGFIGRLAGRFGEPALVKTGLLTMGVGLLMVSRGTIPWFVAGSVVNVSGFALASPGLSTLASRKAPEGSQGTALGTFQSLGSVGRILGPLAGGALFDTVAPTAPFGAGAGLAVAAGLVVLLVMRGEAWRLPYTVDEPPPEASA